MKYRIGNLSLLAPYSCASLTQDAPFLLETSITVTKSTPNTPLFSRLTKPATKNSELFYRCLKSYSIARPSSRRKKIKQLQHQALLALHYGYSQQALVWQFSTLLNCQKNFQDFKAFLTKRKEKLPICKKNLKSQQPLSTNKSSLGLIDSVNQKLDSLYSDVKYLQNQITGALLNCSAVFNSSGGMTLTFDSKSINKLNQCLGNQNSKLKATLHKLQRALVSIFAEAELIFPHISLVLGTNTNGDLWLQTKLLQRKVTENLQTQKLSPPHRAFTWSSKTTRVLSRRTYTSTGPFSYRMLLRKWKPKKSMPRERLSKLQQMITTMNSNILRMNQLAPEHTWKNLATMESKYLRLSARSE